MPSLYRLGDDDIALVSDLFERAGIAPVLLALAERCAFESTARGAPVGWDDVFQTLMRAAQRVSDLEAARRSTE
jgi:hypothetical protein